MKSQCSERPAIFSGHIAVSLASVDLMPSDRPAGSKVAGQDCDYSCIGESLGPFEAKLSGACTRGAFNGGRTI
jgi:hypothetical protein